MPGAGRSILNLWTIIPLGTCIVYVLIFVLAVQKIKRPMNRAFVLYLGLAAFWSFTSFMVRIQNVPEYVLFWNRLLAVALIAALVAYYYFTRLYTSRRPDGGVKWGFVIVGFLALVSTTTDWVIKSSYVEEGIIYHEYGPVIYVIGAISLLYTFSVLYMLWKKYVESIDPIDRNRTAYLLAGWTIMASLTYTNLIPALKGFPLDHMGSFINIAIIAYAITWYDLLDIRLVTRRGLSWVIVGVLIAATFAGIISALTLLFPDLSSIIGYTIAAVILVVITIVLKPVRENIERFIDRIVFWRTYDHRISLAEFCRIMGGNLNLATLSNELLSMLNKAIGTSRSYLLLRDSESQSFLVQFEYPKTKDIKSITSVMFNPDSPIINWLDQKEMHLTIEKIDTLPQFKALWTDEREKLAEMEVQILFPLKNKGKLIAVLCLGPKHKGRKYYAEDISVVDRITSEAGTIIENAQLYAFAMEKVNIDGLTGLYNHRHFHERLEEEIARSSRSRKGFSMIMADIDIFKTYNDIYGHLAGDRALRKAGQYIVFSIRATDQAFRYGGEEFAIILPDTSTEEAYIVAERIRKTIEAKTSICSMPLTMSLGIAGWPDDGIMREELIRAADNALYRAKYRGRNCTVLSNAKGISDDEVLLNDNLGYPNSIGVIYALAAKVDAKDSYTYGHSRKVSEYAVRLARELNLSEQQIRTIRIAGLLHDIGKIGISDSILNKPDELTLPEWRPLKMHPEIGVEIVKHIPELADCVPPIMHHHERYDGKGYPVGLAGKDIPVGARILAVADAYDAMTNPRPYRERMLREEAMAELKNNAGTQFDPELVGKFCCIIKALRYEKPAI